MVFLPKKNIIAAVLVSLFLCFLIFALFPLASQRMLSEFSRQFVVKGEDVGRVLYGQEQGENARENMAVLVGFLGDLAEDSLFGPLSEEDRKAYFLDFAGSGRAPFTVIDGAGRIWGAGSLDIPERAEFSGGDCLISDGSGGRMCFAYFAPWDWILAVPVDMSRAEVLVGKIHDLWKGHIDVILDYQRRKAILFIGTILGILLLYSFLINYFIYKERDRSQEFSQYYRALNESLCLIVTDRNGIITKANENFEKISGYAEEELIGKSHFYGHHPDSIDKQREEMKQSLYTTHRWRGMIKGMRPDGESYWLQTLIGEMWDGRGEISGYLAVAQNVTELHSQKRKLEKAVYTDPLTGFGNRLQLIEDLESYPDSYIACYNIDGFSNINKLFGFTSGDSLLLEVGRVLDDQLLRDREFLYRLNGDTFAVRGIGDEVGVFIDRNLDRQEFLNPLSFEKGTFPYTVSLRLGIATCPQNTLLLADSAMKGAKSDSRGYMVIRDSVDEENATGLKQIEQLNLIKSALEEDRLSLVFQPIANTSTGDIVKYECLLRVQDEKGTVVNPSELIEVAKKGRLYKQITRFVINEVMKACEKSDKDFSINFTLEDFLDRETVKYLVEESAARNVSERIIVEIVETEELADYENLEIIFRSLKEKGFRIAIDDFGAGFSNFNYLLRLNVDYIKIDGSLIRNILTDEKSQSLVVSIILFAVESGFLTIAEYIENAEVMDRIRALGIDFAQGYHIGKPGELP